MASAAFSLSTSRCSSHCWDLLLLVLLDLSVVTRHNATLFSLPSPEASYASWPIFSSLSFIAPLSELVVPLGMKCILKSHLACMYHARRAPSPGLHVYHPATYSCTNKAGVAKLQTVLFAAYKSPDTGPDSTHHDDNHVQSQFQIWTARSDQGNPRLTVSNV